MKSIYFQDFSRVSSAVGSTREDFRHKPHQETLSHRSLLRPLPHAPHVLRTTSRR